MKKLLLLLLVMTAAPLFAQNYNGNVIGIQYSSGPSVPGSCSREGSFFFKNTTTTGWYQCSGGTYQALGGAGGGAITGSGTPGTLMRWTGATTAGDSFCLTEISGETDMTNCALALSGSFIQLFGTNSIPSQANFQDSETFVATATGEEAWNLNFNMDVAGVGGNPNVTGIFLHPALTGGGATSTVISLDIVAPTGGTAGTRIALQAGNTVINGTFAANSTSTFDDDITISGGVNVNGGTFLTGLWAGNVSTLNFSSNCISATGVCGAAPTGAFTIAAAATTRTVSTTAVTANSRIFIMEDQTLGTALSVTCNTGTIRTYFITAKTAATSFQVTTSSAPVTNPACLTYVIAN